MAISVYAADALRDLADVETSDKERAVFLIGLILPMLINQHYRISGRWLFKPKRLFNDLEDWDTNAARLARHACNDRVNPGDRYAAVRALADHVLAPLGGTMPIEWNTQWELLEATNAKPNSPPETSLIGPSRPCLKNSCPQCRRKRINPNRRE